MMLNNTGHQRNASENLYEVSAQNCQDSHHQKRQITNVGEGVEKREPSHTVGGNVNWGSHFGEQYGGFSKN